LRRTKAEVLPDLPQLMRKFQHVELDRKLNKAYDEALKELDDLMYNEEMDGMQKSSNMLAIMNKMRQITGISKVAEAVDFVTEHLLSNERKIVIFTHHLAVATMLKEKLDNWLADGGYSKCLHMNSSLNADERQNLVVKFKDDNNSRVMIASTLAAGEGLNLQFCSDAVMLERQWNPANEEQAEGRFHRFGQLNAVSVTYMIASETIDEYFTELVEQKRAIVSSTLDNKEVAWDQNSLMSELAMILTTKGKKAWKL
jgi:SNF2 family DNA or RNA helicase